MDANREKMFRVKRCNGFFELRIDANREKSEFLEKGF